MTLRCQFAFTSEFWASKAERLKRFDLRRPWARATEVKVVSIPPIGYLETAVISLRKLIKAASINKGINLG
jgi:hypothetical protein